MPAILWTTSMDRTIAKMRSASATWEQVAAALGVSESAARRRGMQTAALAVTYSEAAHRAQVREARTTQEALDRRFAAVLVSSCDGPARDAWRLYHERKLPPATCAQRLGVDRSEFWTLVAEQTRRLADLTMQAANASVSVPAERNRPPNAISIARKAYLERREAERAEA